MIQAVNMNNRLSSLRFGYTQPPGTPDNPKDLMEELLKNFRRVPSASRIPIIGVSVGLTAASSWDDIEQHLGGNTAALDDVAKALRYSSWQGLKQDAEQFEQKAQEVREKAE